MNMPIYFWLLYTMSWHPFIKNNILISLEKKPIDLHEIYEQYFMKKFQEKSEQK